MVVTGGQDVLVQSSEEGGGKSTVAEEQEQSNEEKLLELVASLSDESAKGQQVEINNYVSSIFSQ